ncbi:MAG TPA: universal stress protein [Candidatus Bathyarchaeia archaeon]|nr:universal stress protein [Candidatus Bathyarchaeia archaeon]
MKEILLPTDFSASADLAAEVAAAMAVEAGARLHVVHVVPPATDPSLGSEQLTRYGRLLGKRLAVEISLLSGRAAREITSYARDKGIDVIVMSTHGRSGWSRALLGSVTEAVVRMAPCFVLTVPAALARAGAAPSEESRALPASFTHRCIVCAADSGDLVCDKCRKRIRDEALDQKVRIERAAHRGPTE